jgi:hypothetical protein
MDSAYLTLVVVVAEASAFVVVVAACETFVPLVVQQELLFAFFVMHASFSAWVHSWCAAVVVALAVVQWSSLFVDAFLAIDEQQEAPFLDLAAFSSHLMLAVATANDAPRQITAAANKRLIFMRTPCVTGRGVNLGFRAVSSKERISVDLL